MVRNIYLRTCKLKLPPAHISQEDTCSMKHIFSLCFYTQKLTNPRSINVVELAAEPILSHWFLCDCSVLNGG